MLATQRWPASRTGRDSARLGVLVGLRASAGGALDADARARPILPRHRFWRARPASVSSLATSEIFFMIALGSITPLLALADPSGIEVHGSDNMRQWSGLLGPWWGLCVQAGIQGAPWHGWRNNALNKVRHHSCATPPCTMRFGQLN